MVQRVFKPALPDTTKEKKIKIMLTNSSTKLACFVFKVMETMVPVSGNGGFSKCVLSKIAKVEETEVHS